MPRKKPAPRTFRVITDTEAHSGNFTALQFVTAGSFAVLEHAGNATGTRVTFPSGFKLDGPITRFALSSGTLVAYEN